MGIIKTNTDFRCFRSDTSKLVYVPFLDLTNSHNANGMKIQPMIRNEFRAALFISSKPTMTNNTYKGIVNKGWPTIEIILAIFCFIV